MILSYKDVDVTRRIWCWSLKELKILQWAKYARARNWSPRGADVEREEKKYKGQRQTKQTKQKKKKENAEQTKLFTFDGTLILRCQFYIVFLFRLKYAITKTSLKRKTVKDTRLNLKTKLRRETLTKRIRLLMWPWTTVKYPKILKVRAFAAQRHRQGRIRWSKIFREGRIKGKKGVTIQGVWW